MYAQLLHSILHNEKDLIYSHDLYSGLSHPWVVCSHAVLTAITIVGGPAVMVLVKHTLDMVKLDLVIYDIGHMGILLMVVVYHIIYSCSFLVR